VAQLVGYGESEKIGEICGSKNRALLDGVGQHYGVAILE
jgi:hypothetical protein